MKKLRTNRLFYVFIPVILSSLLTSCANAVDTFNSTPAVEHKQLLTSVNSDIKEETPEPLKKPRQPEPSPEFENQNKRDSKPFQNLDLDPAAVKIPVLMYHSINKNSTNNLIITPQEFEKQVRWLKENEFTPLFLDELYLILTTGKNIPQKPVALTFDDGYEDNYTEAYPILKKYNFKATIFLISDTIGQPPVLKENQIKEMYANNIDFQSHTASHRELNGLSYEKQLEELSRSKEAIAKMLNKNIDYLCYPVGKYNEDTIKAAKTAGYKMAFTTKPGHAKQSDGLYTITRVRMSPGMSMQVLNTKRE
jgi:peptidoglycan/xylan/chitin deacetylase (PgdA/CDA1 family)